MVCYSPLLFQQRFAQLKSQHHPTVRDTYRARAPGTPLMNGTLNLEMIYAAISHLFISHSNPKITFKTLTLFSGTAKKRNCSCPRYCWKFCFSLWKLLECKVNMHSICWQIWKIHQWPQNWKGSVFIPIPKKDNGKECSNCHTIALISHASKVMLKILQARLQQ